MVFTTPFFLFYFLPLALGVYYALPRSWRNGFLTLASYLFYGWWSPWFVSLMLASTLIDYACGRVVSAPGAPLARRRAAVAVSVIANLSLLGFFKYFVFAQENLNRMLELLGAQAFAVFEVVLPIGISFYTFQSMSYSIDLYRGHAPPARSLSDLACYVALFPQLIAGPIVRYSHLADQLRRRPERAELLAEGALTFMVGFAKKVLIANTMAEIADLCFAAEALPAHVAWFGVTAYAFQIYFDFSGYSDMAIGLGAMFGFRIPINFRSPFRAESITEYWQRWHLSLTSWLRDYLYIPLGGNRLGPLRTYLNLLVVMVLGGLWHGAAWNYLIWGALHGLVMALERMRSRSAPYAFLPRPARVLLTFLLLDLLWVLFRCESAQESLRFLGAMFGGSGTEAAAAVTAGRAYQTFNVLAVALAAGLVWFGTETVELVRRATARPTLALGVFGAFLLAVVAMYSQAENPFIYFRF